MLCRRWSAEPPPNADPLPTHTSERQSTSWGRRTKTKGSPSAGCHPPFPRPGNDQRRLTPADIAVMSLVTSSGTVQRCGQAALPAAIGKPAADPIAPSKDDAPWWTALATPGGSVDCEPDGQAYRTLVDTGSNITLVHLGVLSAAWSPTTVQMRMVTWERAGMKGTKPVRVGGWEIVRVRPG